MKRIPAILLIVAAASCVFAEVWAPSDRAEGETADANTIQCMFCGATINPA